MRQIRFGRAICGDLGQAQRREWWITNGLGGYAAGTIASALTRRYHGLLIAPVAPPLDRRLLLAKADATLVDGDDAWPLFTNRWAGGALAPAGNARIESFALEHSVPVWTYAVGGRRIEASIWMEPGANTTYAAWRLSPVACPPQHGMALRVTLLVNNRDHNGQTSIDGFRPAIEADGDTLRVTDPGVFSLAVRAKGGHVGARRDWYRDFELPVETERGLDPIDSHLCAGEATIPLIAGQWCGITASLHDAPSADIAAALERRLGYDRSAVARALDSGAEMRDAPGWIGSLALAADAFVFARPLPDVPDGQSVIAGYPWFGDWGRDTMISLPGLTLATGRAETAGRILRTFARFVSQGMLPNVFPGIGDRPDYNTADASLWFFEAWRAYIEATDDLSALREAFPVLSEMIDWHQKGTRYGIAVDPADGLLKAGIPGMQVTWMDAKVGGWVVTPQIGKPVEINALWYNALRVMTDFATRLRRPDRYTPLAAAAESGFGRFVRPDGLGLYDVIDGPDGDDASIRPNQIFAVSLSHSPLSSAHQASVVRVCRRMLLTSYGLRSLAPGSPDYHPHYLGGVTERDGGYHQGPVWAWLLGPFALAEYRVTGDAAAALAVLAPMRDTLEDQGLGTIGEIFDGDPPHDPRGAPAQAWSVACTLDAWRRLKRAERESRAG